MNSILNDDKQERAANVLKGGMHCELDLFLQLQDILNQKAGCPSVDNMNQEQQIEWLLKFSRSLLHEDIEFERELPWKHWKKNQEFNINNAKDEAIDILHFLLSIFIYLKMDAKEIRERYLIKNKINHDRQNNGY